MPSSGTWAARTRTRRGRQRIVAEPYLLHRLGPALNPRLAHTVAAKQSQLVQELRAEGHPTI